MEDRKMVLALDILRTLKCAICDCYLTIPPIMIISVYGNEYKCGRCRFVPTDLNVPATIFEAVALSMKFPCIFPNCEEKLDWGDIKAHEEVCPYQPMKCPCGDIVEMQSSQIHFRNSHPEIISKDKAILENPGFALFHTRVILKNDIPFLVYILCARKGDIKVGVYCLQETMDRYEFKLELGTNSSTTVITIPDQKIIKFKTRENCSDCLLKTCKVRYHKYYQSNQDAYNNDVYNSMCVRINAMSVLNILDSDTISLTITIVEKGTIVDYELMISKNELIRKSWECPICQEYLTAPIYICPTGHSLCGSCKSKLTNCPYCVKTLGESRNFTLEDMTENVELICQYQDKGCNFMGNVVHISKHEPKCAWKNWEDVNTPRKKQKFPL